MIVRVPGSDDQYSIINLYWGLSIAVLGNKQSLTVTATTVTSPLSHWSFAHGQDTVRYVDMFLEIQQVR
jgi:hypothetical protein